MSSIDLILVAEESKIWGEAISCNTELCAWGLLGARPHWEEGGGVGVDAFWSSALEPVLAAFLSFIGSFGGAPFVFMFPTSTLTRLRVWDLKNGLSVTEAEVSSISLRFILKK